MKEDSEVLTLEIGDFCLWMQQYCALAARIKLTKEDVMEGTIIEMRLILSRNSTTDGYRNLIYKFETIVVNKTQRNLALELCEIMKALGVSHLNALSESFNSRISKYVESISNFCMPKGSDANIFSNIKAIQVSSYQKINFIQSTFKSFFRKGHNNYIKFLDYPISKDQRCLRYASDIGRSYTTRGDFEMIRTIFLQFCSECDFIKNSKEADDPFYLPFIPKGEKFDIVKMAAQHWYTDEYFCNELFNGCNPFTIRQVSPSEVRDAFKQLTDDDDRAIDLE